MALEVSAAIIGILAAAGKVAETLGPVVSAFVDAPEHSQSILTEVRYTRTILLGLQTLFDELNTIPQRRRQLIQIDQLVATLTDGVLLFSELEALVDKLGDPNDALLRRAKWARKDHELEYTVTKLSGFKISVTLMLNILRCESDIAAQYDRRVLLENTANILKNNVDLSRRLAHLESQLDANRSVVTKRTINTTSASLNNQMATLTVTSDLPTGTPFFVDDAPAVFQFEPVLKASGVYRRVRRESADYSFCSSIPLSHAWTALTALSDMSLSDISAISVIALPIQRADIANAHRYDFTNWPLGIEDDSVSQRPESRGSMGTVRQSSLRSVMTLEPRPVLHGSSESSNFMYPLTRYLRVAVVGAPATDVSALVRRFTHQSSEPGNLYDKLCIIDDIETHLAIETINDFSDNGSAEMQTTHFRWYHLFMLVYSATSRESFEKVDDLIPRVGFYKDSSGHPPVMIVGVHNDDVANERIVPESEGYEFAQLYDLSFREVNESSLESIQNAFLQLARQMRPPASQNCYRKPFIPHKADVEESVVKPKTRRLGGLRRKTKIGWAPTVRQSEWGTT